MTAAPPGSGAPLPWQQTEWQRLLAADAAGRLPHALLLTGPAGFGKRQFADALARRLLCHSAAETAAGCGRCRSCRQFDVHSHGDVLVVDAEPNKPLRVDQIRALNAFVGLSSHGGGRRIVVIHDAERMNVNAANSLLKTLEEPPPRRLLVLTAATPSRLPATIRSRCQRLAFARPDVAVAASWLRARQTLDAERAVLLLQLAGYAPLRALTLADDAVLAHRQQLFDGYRTLLLDRRAPPPADWLQPDLVRHLGWLHGWLQDLLRLALAAGLPAERLANPDLHASLRELAAREPARRWHRRLDMARNLLVAMTEAPQLNAELQLSALFQTYLDRSGRTR